MLQPRRQKPRQPSHLVAPGGGIIAEEGLRPEEGRFLMVRHMLLLRVQPGTPPAQLETLAEEFTKLCRSLPAVAACRCGPALNLPGSSAEPVDFAICLDFATPEDFDSYVHDPRHIAFVREWIAPLRLSSYSAQISL